MFDAVELADLLAPDSLSYGIVQPGHHDSSGIPIVRVSDLVSNGIDASSPLRVSPAVEGQYARSRLRGGEVLVSVVGTVGRVAVVPPQLSGWNIARAIAVVRPDDPNDAAWIRYCLESHPAQRQMHLRKTDTVQATLNLRDLKTIRVPYPARGERERIVAVLGALDDLIDTNRRLQETLAHQRMATIARVVSSALDLTTFGEIADLVRVQVSPLDVTHGTAYLGLEHFAENARGLLGVGVTDGLDSAKWRFEPGDVLYGKLRPYFRKVVRPHFGGVCSTELWVLRPKEGVSSEYLEWVVSTQEFTDFAVAGSTGTRMPRANWDHIRTFVVSKPIGTNFVRALAASRVMWEQYWALYDENQEVACVRDELLPLLLSGRVRVEEVAA
jgi:type I restriction enzyme, S subunit